MNKESRNDRRKRKYNILINAGFNSNEATKYKDLSNYKVAELCKVREKANIKIDRELIELEKDIAIILKGAI